jgi:NAD-dependent SIR2 family protein deacetylase
MIDALNEMIEESEHIVFLGGAGVSTESGIPDFIFENKEEIPHCPNCGKMVRPDVTLYGKFLPQRAYEEAVAPVLRLDLRRTWHICTMGNIL